MYCAKYRPLASDNICCRPVRYAVHFFLLELFNMCRPRIDFNIFCVINTSRHATCNIHRPNDNNIGILISTRLPVRGCASPSQHVLYIGRIDNGKGGSKCAFWYPSGHGYWVAYTSDNTICSNIIRILHTGNCASIVFSIYVVLRCPQRY